MPHHTVFINVFEVVPTKQSDLITVLSQGAERVVSGRPGFISATLYASTDGTRVVNIARWKRPEDAQLTQADPEAAEYAGRAAALAIGKPGLFTIVGEYSA